MLAAITINWMQIIQWLMLIFGGLGTAGLAVQWAVKNRPKPNPDPKPTDPKSPALPVRSADEPPPVGSQEWLIDILISMGGQTTDTGEMAVDSKGPTPLSVLNAALLGSSRDQARARRIAELEGRKNASEPA